MKLIFCPECHDIRKIKLIHTKCECGESWGYYLEDGYEAKIGGKAIPIGFQNSSFMRALTKRPKSGLGSIFEAFVIPHECPTVGADGDGRSETDTDSSYRIRTHSDPQKS